MEKPVETVLGALVVPECSPVHQEPPHEAVWRSLLATYQKEQGKPPSAHTAYKLYEEARFIANQGTLVTRKAQQRHLRARLRMPNSLVDDYMRVIDETCLASPHRQVWRRRPDASTMDTFINKTLALQVKRALKRNIPKGRYGRGDVNKTNAIGTTAKIVRFTSGDIVGRVGEILGKLWGQRTYPPWKGRRTQCTYVDVVPQNPRKNFVTVMCRGESVVEPIGKHQKLQTPSHFIVINFPINER